MYLPVNKRTVENFHEYKSVLAEIEALIVEQDVSNIIITGDLNAHPYKQPNWDEIDLFCEKYNMNVLDLNRLPADAFTYLSPSCLAQTWLDHIICSHH